MNANNLITTTARRLRLTEEECSAGAKALAECFSEIFTEAGSLSVPGFGRFTVEKHDETVRFDKFSGERILMPPRLELVFTYNPDEEGELEEMPECLNKELAREIFHTARLGVERDRYVRLPEIGVFKQTDHELLFTPDRLLRDKVNSPFAYFSEEVLGEGVMFEEEIRKKPHKQENQKEQQEEQQEEAKTEEKEEIIPDTPLPHKEENEDKEEDRHLKQSEDTDTIIRELRIKLEAEEQKNRRLGALCALLATMLCAAIILML